MQNPFPGMDPYLEGDLWMTVHAELISDIARQLAPKVRPKYVVFITRRVVLAPPDENNGGGQDRIPDLGIHSVGQFGTLPGTAVASAPLVFTASFPEPIPHLSIEIRDIAERRLVTCIEVLSPTNERGSGRDEYAGKRFQIISGDAHLVEVDLLRVGDRFPTGEPLPPTSYFVFVSHAERRKQVQVWPIALEQPLPTIGIPLLPDDPPTSVDLQKALSVVYEVFAYDEIIDYNQPPPGPLTHEQAAWIDEQLRRAGRRR
jgi:hypothetical protein